MYILDIYKHQHTYIYICMYKMRQHLAGNLCHGDLFEGEYLSDAHNTLRLNKFGKMHVEPNQILGNFIYFILFYGPDGLNPGLGLWLRRQLGTSPTKGLNKWRPDMCNSKAQTYIYFLSMLTSTTHYHIPCWFPIPHSCSLAYSCNQSRCNNRAWTCPKRFGKLDGWAANPVRGKRLDGPIPHNFSDHLKGVYIYIYIYTYIYIYVYTCMYV